MVTNIVVLCGVRIHEILIRIRIYGSIPLTNGSGSSYFRQCTFKTSINNKFFPLFFAYHFLKVYLHHFPKKKSHKVVTTQIKVFHTILLDDGSMASVKEDEKRPERSNC